MRRRRPCIVPPLPGSETPKRAGPAPQALHPVPKGCDLDKPVQVSFTLPLECITPVVGGGVESREPDALEGVRLQGIRGQLRAWWRALHRDLPHKELLDQETWVWGAAVRAARESRVWGGTGLEQDGEEKPFRSQVQFAVTVLSGYKDLPAGRYKGSGGRYKSLPEWDGGRAMGYGLFPLQLERKELNALRIANPPTRSVRKHLKFDLEVTVRLSEIQDGEARGASAIDVARRRVREVLAALWLWVHFGGIGSRTTRGFGALALRSGTSFPLPLTWVPGLSQVKEQADLETYVRGLLEFFRPPSSRDLPKWLDRVAPAFEWPGKGQRQGFHPCLPPKEVLAGRLRTQATAALTDGLGQLMTFRQGPGIGRAPGRPRPGRSYWPEADTLRRIAVGRRRARFSRHAPVGPDGYNGAPRAGFGMPLNMPFKDRDDKVADGVFAPRYHNRWPSPLRMRPLRCADGYVSLMVYLDQPLPPDNNQELSNPGKKVAAILVRFRNYPEVEKAVPVRKSEGAAGPICEYLEKAKGDAVDAFFRWLKEERGYSRVKGR